MEDLTIPRITIKDCLRKSGMHTVQVTVSPCSVEVRRMEQFRDSPIWSRYCCALHSLYITDEDSHGREIGMRIIR